MVTITIDIDTAREMQRACVSSAQFRGNQRDKSAEVDAIRLDALAWLFQKAIVQAGLNKPNN